MQQGFLCAGIASQQTNHTEDKAIMQVKLPGAGISSHKCATLILGLKMYLLNFSIYVLFVFI